MPTANMQPVNTANIRAIMLPPDPRPASGLWTTGPNTSSSSAIDLSPLRLAAFWISPIETGCCALTALAESIRHRATRQSSRWRMRCFSFIENDSDSRGDKKIIFCSFNIYQIDDTYYFTYASVERILDSGIEAKHAASQERHVVLSAADPDRQGRFRFARAARNVSARRFLRASVNRARRWCQPESPSPAVLRIDWAVLKTG